MKNMLEDHPTPHARKCKAPFVTTWLLNSFIFFNIFLGRLFMSYQGLKSRLFHKQNNGEFHFSVFLRDVKNNHCIQYIIKNPAQKDIKPVLNQKWIINNYYSIIIFFKSLKVSQWMSKYWYKNKAWRNIVQYQSCTQYHNIYIKTSENDSFSKGEGNLGDCTGIQPTSFFRYEVQSLTKDVDK